MRNFFRGFIRASAFFRKEIFENLRQPRMIATLVIGPFLILFIFGIGYRAQSRSLRTVFVSQPDSPISAEDVRQYSEAMGTLFVSFEVTQDENNAFNRLRRGQIDLVITEPPDIMTTIRNNQQALFTLYHREVDPAQVSYINYLGWLYSGAVNQRVLLSFVVQAQKESLQLQAGLKEAQQNVSEVRQAVKSGDETLGQQQQQTLTRNVSALEQAVGASLELLNTLRQNTQDANADPTSSQNALARLRKNEQQLMQSTATAEDRLARLDEMDQDLSTLDAELTTLQEIDPTILVSPFRSEAKGLVDVQPTILDYFAPAVLALLLQHLAITLAALSIVRERSVGTLELFRVSPLSAAETLLGKYLSYMLLGAIVTASLSALLVFVLHVPMLGSWWNFALVLAVMLFSSLGIGFFISIISQNDSQAVQYSMIVLLASVFFSGFILGLDTLWEPVRVISWMLPNTYGTLLLRDIALRGIAPNWIQLGGLAGIGLLLLLVSWLFIRRLISSPE